MGGKSEDGSTNDVDKTQVKSDDANMKDVEEPGDATMTDTVKNSKSDKGDGNTVETDLAIKEENSEDATSPSQKTVDDSAPVSMNEDTKKDSEVGNGIDANDAKVEKKNDSEPAIDTKLDRTEKKDASDDNKLDQKEEKKGTASDKKSDQIAGKNDSIAGTTDDKSKAETAATGTSEKSEASKPTLSMEERSGKFAAMAKKRGLPAEEKIR